MSSRARSFVRGVLMMVESGAARIEDEYPQQARELLALVPAIYKVLSTIPSSPTPLSTEVKP